MLFGKFIEIGSTLKDFQDEEAVVGFNSKISMCFSVCVCFFFLFFFTHFKEEKKRKESGGTTQSSFESLEVSGGYAHTSIFLQSGVGTKKAPHH